MEYFVRFADGVETMVALTFGPMEKLIKAYEKQQAKPKPTDDKKTKKSTVMCENIEIFQWLLTIDETFNSILFVCLFICLSVAKSG